MTELVVFGGTAEGRALCERLGQRGIAALVCVATEYGQSLLQPRGPLRVRTGRLDRGQMEDLFRAERPRLVIDATHPYATQVSENLRAACEAAGVRHVRLLREEIQDTDGCTLFPHMDALVDWLNGREGTIFSALGAKEAATLTAVRDFQNRVWLRILPDQAGLRTCLEAGFPARHIICMQGPFSAALNAAMFRAAGADILLTKESGAVGGYPEKLEAARACGMAAAVLARPSAGDGLTLAALMRQIEEDRL